MTVRFADLVCHAHEGPWGNDPTCGRCTDDDGSVLPYRMYTTDPGIARVNEEMERVQTYAITEDGVVANAETGEIIEPVKQAESHVEVRVVTKRAWVGPFLLGVFSGWAVGVTGLLALIVTLAVNVP